MTHLHHTTWGQREGLPVSGVFKIERSPDGHLWLGSTVGLLRFDGVRFTELDGATTPALRSKVPGEMWLLLVDREGVFWINRPDGALGQYRDGVFREVVPPGAADRMSWNLSQDGAGRLWLSSGERAGRTFHLLRNGRIEMVWDKRAPELDELDLADAIEAAMHSAVRGQGHDHRCALLRACRTTPAVARNRDRGIAHRA